MTAVGVNVFMTAAMAMVAWSSEKRGRSNQHGRRDKTVGVAVVFPFFETE